MLRALGHVVWLGAVLFVAAACEKQTPAASVGADGRTEIKITVDGTGYHPAEARAPGGKPVRMVVTRTSEDPCGEEIVVPSAGIKKNLPLNQPVSIDLTMPASGKLAFACGMDMMRGALIAE
jgi:plastocyanin domain-containing protein